MTADRTGFIKPKLAMLAALGICFVLSLIIHLTVPAQPPRHGKIALRGYDGSVLTKESKAPYSPRKTCGVCHPYEEIVRAYHFQLGRTGRDGSLVISDSFDQRNSWNLSPGMYGKHSFVRMDSSQLAKKNNTSPSEIDKSSFYFVQNCGRCHAGGGPGEYDRKGNLYYDEAKTKFGYGPNTEKPILDGDYTPFNAGDSNYGSPWDKSGLSEADCLICHLKGYRWKERAISLESSLFRYAPSAGAGWVDNKSIGSSKNGTRFEQPAVDYTRSEVADFENLHLQIVKQPDQENCLFCHAGPAEKRDSFQWSAEKDVHRARKKSCVFCHPGNIEHNFAKGDSINQTVRDDLDNTMFSCEDCHLRRKDKKAPSHKHPFSPRHMKRIACQTCHIPFVEDEADLVYDLASTGSPVIYGTSKFLQGPSPDRADSPRQMSGRWYPAIRLYKGKIIPVRSVLVVYWGDLEEASNSVKPVPLWKIREMKKPPLKDDDGDGIAEINSNDEIKAFLHALRTKDRFGNAIARNPVLIKGNALYKLNRKGEIEKSEHEQAMSEDISLNHLVIAGSNVIGSRGCKDCHSKNSPFFLRKILVDPWDEKGKPIYVELWQRLGFDKQKLDRLLLEQ